MPLRFECPHCSLRLSAGRDMYHVVTDCPECSKEFMIPAPEDIKLPTDEIKFVCPTCKRKLSATPEQFGTEMPCPFTDCQIVLQVPDGGFTPIPVPPRED